MFKVMATANQFEDLNCWMKAREVCKFLGGLIDQGKFKKSYRLINQIEGSSGSIMDNIAEGFERGTRLEFITFLGYAKGSCGELRSQLFRALDRSFISQEEFEHAKALALHTSALIQKLIAYLQQSTIAGNRKKDSAKEH
jgi:four helix bundle protein